uniref:All trans-polyprenyl-diphosphate synthase PDSS1 n=1 Tax=Oncorhynchus mykiss TaxID=8022 RepID=A0A8K9V3P5_ONCMY
MAIPWRHCWRWTTGATSTSVLETICGFNGRSATFAALSLRGTGAVAGSGKERLSSRPEDTTSIGNYILTSRHKSRLLYPTQKPCCCKRIHSDAKLKDPFTLAQKDLNHLYDDIKKELFVSKSELKSLCDYYFDGKGKAFRPMIVVLMARACNIHSNRDGDLLPGQRSIAMISEMIHTASLVHDDVIDGSDKRRGKTTINEVWGERKAILAGDFILSAASMALARIGNNTVVSVLSQVIEDLVRGEFMQLGSKENESERFKHYLEKSFKKTASLIANSCKAVSILVNSDPEVQEIAFQYGRNVGIAFQLVDDVLDFTACASQLGKPSATDLKLGLATGPVLFACQQFPELHAMIMRRFSTTGDVDRAWQYVLEVRLLMKMDDTCLPFVRIVCFKSNLEILLVLWLCCLPLHCLLFGVLYWVSVKHFVTTADVKRAS